MPKSAICPVIDWHSLRFFPKTICQSSAIYFSNILAKFAMWLHNLLTKFTRYFHDLLTKFEIFPSIFSQNTIFFFNDHSMTVHDFFFLLFIYSTNSRYLFLWSIVEIRILSCNYFPFFFFFQWSFDEIRVFPPSIDEICNFFLESFVEVRKIFQK